MQVATVPVQICTDTIACAYNFLTIFSLSSLYLSLSSLSLSLSAHNSFFLPLIWSIFLPLASIDCHRRRHHRWSLFLPLFLVVFGLNGLDQWVSGWMSLAIAIATACLWRRQSYFLFSPSPPKALILLLKARCQFQVGCVDSGVIPVWIVGVGQWLCG